jgi:FixJ family two-component response regulator
MPGGCGLNPAPKAELFFNLRFPRVHNVARDDTGAIVFVVDDDSSVRDAVKTLLKSVGLNVQAFGSTEALLDALHGKRPTNPSCLVLDVRLPGMSGLEFQQELKSKGIRIPIIFVTGHGDIPMTSRAIKAGALEFLPKPFQKQELLAAIHHALDRDRNAIHEESGIAKLRNRYESLTEREREVMQLVVTGLMNKEIAAKLTLREITIKVHRGHAMRKMKANSLADLVRMAERLKLQPLS